MTEKELRKSIRSLKSTLRSRYNVLKHNHFLSDKIKGDIRDEGFEKLEKIIKTSTRGASKDALLELYHEAMYVKGLASTTVGGIKRAAVFKEITTFGTEKEQDKFWEIYGNMVKDGLILEKVKYEQMMLISNAVESNMSMYKIRALMKAAKESAYLKSVKGKSMGITF